MRVLSEEKFTALGSPESLKKKFLNRPNVHLAQRSWKICDYV